MTMCTLKTVLPHTHSLTSIKKKIGNLFILPNTMITQEKSQECQLMPGAFCINTSPSYIIFLVPKDLTLTKNETIAVIKMVQVSNMKKDFFSSLQYFIAIISNDRLRDSNWRLYRMQWNVLLLKPDSSQLNSGQSTMMCVMSGISHLISLYSNFSICKKRIIEVLKSWKVIIRKMNYGLQKKLFYSLAYMPNHYYFHLGENHFCSEGSGTYTINCHE